MAETKTEEPSIEEILDSIRQIIAEDGDKSGAAEDRPGEPVDLSPVEDVSAMDRPGPEVDLTPKAGMKDKAVEVDLRAKGEAIYDRGGAEVDLSPRKEAPDRAGPEVDLTPKAAMQDKAVEVDLSPRAEDNEDDDFLDLTQDLMADEPEAAEEMQEETQALDEPDTGNDAMTDTPEEMAAPVQPPKTPSPSAAKPAEEEGLLSDQTMGAAADALSKLLATNVAVERQTEGKLGSVTLEDMARELMKPLIKTWLDQNLPRVIESAVQKEVEKIARKLQG